MKNGGKSGGFGYVGRIKNSGAQVVQAPIQTTVSKKGTVKTGSARSNGDRIIRGRERPTITQANSGKMAAGQRPEWRPYGWI